MMKTDVPKFLYHGTTLFAYNNFNITRKKFPTPANFMCWKDGIIDGLSFAIKRAKQGKGYPKEYQSPVLFIFDSRKNKIEKHNELNIYLVTEISTNDGYIALAIDPRIMEDSQRYIDSYKVMIKKESKAKELSDFLDMPGTSVLF